MIRLYSVEDTANLLGVKPPTVYKLMASGELAFYQAPGGRKVSEEDLESFLASRRVPAEKEAIHA